MTYMRARTSSKFGQIRLLVPMATDRVIMEKTVLPLFLSCFWSDPFYTCRSMMTRMRARTSLNFGQIGPRDAELRPLKGVRNWFFAQYLENGWTEFNQILYTHYHWQDLYCYCHFSQICNRVTALDRCQKLVFAQYLENGLTEFDQIFVYTLSLTRSMFVS